MKIILVVIALIGVIFLAISAPGLLAGLDDLRTDNQAQQYIVATGVGVTNSTVQLPAVLWEGSPVNASATSNITTDTPVVDNYTASNRVVSISGLTANTTRILTVSYLTAGLTDYTGAEQTSRNFPTIYMVVIILIPILIFVGMILNRLRG
jgi:hypothetical protein